jgi:hypothetical protein
MQYRRLGSSDLRVSEIALGSWLTYGGGVERAQALACIRQAFASGINFIDTANVYGRGAAEALLGDALAGIPRASFVLATGVLPDVLSGIRGPSRAQIVGQLEALPSSVCVPTTWTCTSAIATTRAHRWRNDAGADRCSPAGQGALHRLQRVAGRQAVRAATEIHGGAVSSRASRSTPCSGGRRSREVIPFAAGTPSPRSCGRRSRKGC